MKERQGQATGWDQWFGFPSVLWHCWLVTGRASRPYKAVPLMLRDYDHNKWRKKNSRNQVTQVHFWATVTNKFTLCNGTVVCPVCNVGVLWPNGWMDQDATSYEGRPWPRCVMLDGDPAPPTDRGTAAPPARVYCGQTIAHLTNSWALVETAVKTEVMYLLTYLSNLLRSRCTTFSVWWCIQNNISH